MLFFEATDGTGTYNHGYELWATDGTESGTYMVKDIANGTVSSSIQDIVAIGELLYFIADDGYRGSEIWRSDGTELGTIIVEDLTFGPSDTSFYNINSTGQMLVEAGDILYFVPSTDYGYELWNNMNIETKVLIDN